MTDNALPNQAVTWGMLSKVVEEFDDWQLRTNDLYVDESTQLLAYLMSQIEAEGNPLVGLTFNHPVLSLLSHVSSRNNRLGEFMLAYLAIAISGDCAPAKKLIAGQRLNTCLHPDYVAATRCYDEK